MPLIRRMVPDLRRVGPVIPVRIEQVLAVQEALQAEGSPVPSVAALALLDTGASGTTVQSSLLSAFDLDPISTVLFSTPSTSTPQERFKYRLRLVLAENAAFDTDVVEAPFGGQHVQCLIGRDILERCILTYNGPKQRYTLSVLPEQD